MWVCESQGLQACTKCLKEFATTSFGDQPNYSGFEINKWTKRTNSNHRHHAMQHQKCVTRSAQTEIEREHGCRYSVLLRLPYFDPVQMCVINPMRNLAISWHSPSCDFYMERFEDC